MYMYTAAFVVLCTTSVNLQPSLTIAPAYHGLCMTFVLYKSFVFVHSLQSIRIWLAPS